MSDIKVTAQQSEVGKYWEASNVWVTYRSVNGHDWVRPNGKHIEQQRLEELRSAFYSKLRHLDTTAEPQRAKVGEWVRVLKDKPDGSRCVKGEVYKVLERDSISVKLLDKAGWVSHDDYTIVPEPVPEPEPKTYTGNPKDWGKGVYSNGAGLVVVVDSTGDWFSVGRYGSMYGVGDDGTPFGSTFRRISTDPAAAVRKCFDAISGKGGE